jgi:hypothetical protein
MLAVRYRIPAGPAVAMSMKAHPRNPLDAPKFASLLNTLTRCSREVSSVRPYAPAASDGAGCWRARPVSEYKGAVDLIVLLYSRP